MTRPSLRTMMLVPILLTMAIGFTGFALYIDGVEYQNRLADIDDELVRAARRSGPILSPPAAGAPRPEGEERPEEQREAESSVVAPEEADADEVTAPVQLMVSPTGEVLDTGTALNPFDEAALVDLVRRADSDREASSFSVDDPRYRVLVMIERQGEVLVTALPLDEFDEAVSDLRRALLAAGIFIIMLQALLVWFLTVITIRPVTRMTNTATKVADGELDTEVGPPSGSREVAALTRDLDRMLVRLRDTIERSEASAAEAQRARDDMERFVADVSHEFRTPLTALRGYSELYASGMLNDDGSLDRAMDRIGNETIRLHHLVSDMLDLTKGTVPDEVHDVVDVAAVAHDVVDDLRSAHPDRVIELLVADESAAVMGLAGPLHQSVLNVAANACQHTPPGSPVELHVDVDADSVSVAVVDHGDGIASSDADRILLPFFRGDVSRSRGVAAAGGAGLGLPVAHRYVTRFGGTMAVTDTPGGGTTFTLCFAAAGTGV